MQIIRHEIEPIYATMDPLQVEVLQVPIRHWQRWQCNGQAVLRVEGGFHLLCEKDVFGRICIDASTIICRWVLPV